MRAHGEEGYETECQRKPRVKAKGTGNEQPSHRKSKLRWRHLFEKDYAAYFVLFQTALFNQNKI